MTVAIKFCGLTRAQDAAVAVELGASYIGAVFAGGPRTVTAEQARAVFDGATSVRRVGVFGHQTPDEIARAATRASLDVVQLHADPTPDFVADTKRLSGLETWAAVRVGKALNEANLNALTSSADARLFDSRVDGVLGGSGRAFDWAMITGLLAALRRANARIVLAGGLNPARVSTAIAAIRPDVVDVSSGVESAPGVKDHQLMSEFVQAVRASR